MATAKSPVFTGVMPVRYPVATSGLSAILVLVGPAGTPEVTGVPLCDTVHDAVLSVEDEQAVINPSSKSRAAAPLPVRRERLMSGL
ncbi:hypothetical protein JMUB6875_21410 [Nocardia sp. JMUB6875]